MIIGIDASHANKINRTGVEEYCYQIIQEFKKIIPADVRVILYTPTKLIEGLSKVPNNWEIKILSWPMKKMWSQICLARELANNPPDLYFSPGQLLPLFAPKNSIVMIHDSAFEAFPSAYRFFGRQYLKLMNRLIVKKSKIILTSTEFNKNEILKYYCHSVLSEESLEERIKVIPLAYDKQKYNLQTPVLENKFGKYIVSVGRLEEKKNTKRIIQAFNGLKERIPELKLILAGSPGAGFEMIEKEINLSPFKKDIILPGFVSPGELVSIIKNAEVFVFPSLYEGFGIPILEAMALGVPVVASRGNALEEVGGNAVEYTDSLNVSGLGDVIFGLITDEQKRLQKVNVGLERVQTFSWEKTAGLTWEILKNAK